MANVTYLGTSDDVTTCDCCGRANLKSTVAIQREDEVVYFGVTCAARALKTDAKTVRAGAKSADQARRAQEAHARAAKADADFAQWKAYLDSRCPGMDVFEQIQALGGYTLVRAEYYAVVGEV
jgi:hypothetical protein